MVQTKESYSIIELNFGLIQAGKVQAGGKKLYFIKSGEDKSKPIEIDMMPMNGNPELEVTLITDQRSSRKDWLEAS